jgi:hypothetical protein
MTRLHYQLLQESPLGTQADRDALYQIALLTERAHLVSWFVADDGSSHFVCRCGHAWEADLMPQRDGTTRLLPDTCPTIEADDELARACDLAMAGYEASMRRIRQRTADSRRVLGLGE